jgi:hypothetical protein
MSERFQNDLPDFRLPYFVESFQYLPAWLADRLLRPDEKVAWVRGPRFNPTCERYITHPGLFFCAVAVGAVIVGLARLAGGGSPEPFVIAFLIAGFLVISSIIVLGLTNGYFTRLVVTNLRLVILQGYEICRSWNIDDLPPSLVRYGKRGEKASWSIDLDAVKTMLGGSSDKFADAKSILKFGKQLDSITIRDKNRR